MGSQGAKWPHAKDEKGERGSGHPATPPRELPPFEENAKVAEALYLQGISIRNIAGTMGVSVSYTYRLLDALRRGIVRDIDAERARAREQRERARELAQVPDVFDDETLPLPPWDPLPLPRHKVPKIDVGKTYRLEGATLQFAGFVRGADCRHAIFVHPVAGWRETFRELDLSHLMGEGGQSGEAEASKQH